jgi:hypothetical protein
MTLIAALTVPLWNVPCAAQDFEAIKAVQQPPESSEERLPPWLRERASPHRTPVEALDAADFSAEVDHPAAANPVEMVGRWPFGATNAVAVDPTRPYVYEASGAGIYVLQKQPLGPPLKIAELRLPAVVQGLFYDSAHFRLYAGTRGAGMRIVDVSNAAAPGEIGAAATPTWVEAVWVKGNFAYAAAYSSGLGIFDVSNPASPTLIQTVPTPTGVTLDVQVVDLGGWGTYAFLAEGFGGVRVIDVMIPGSASEVSAYTQTGIYAMGVAVVYPYAFVADASTGLRIINISNPLANPLPQTSFCAITGYAQKVVIPVMMGHAYVACGNGGLAVIDLSNINNPQVVSTWPLPAGSARDLDLAGNELYLSTVSKDLMVFDITTAASPVYRYAFHTPSYAESIFVAGGYGYVADGDSGLWILDLSSPTNPVAVGHCDTPDTAHAVFVVGNYAYVAADWYNLRVIDVSVRTNPHEVGSIALGGWGNSYDVKVVYPYAYLTDDAAGLHIIDISDPTNPQEKGSIGWAGGKAWSVALSGSVAYVADVNAGLRLVDVQDPTAPKDLAFVPMFPPAVASAVVVQGSYAYVAARDNGLLIYDIHDPAQPVQSGWCYVTGMPAYSLTVVGSQAYLMGEFGVFIVDVSKPANPRTTGIFNQIGDFGGMHYAAPYLYTANWERGVSVLAHYASLKVTLKPKSVAARKARWKVGGKPWKKSGATMGRLLPGKHQVRCKPVAGWVTPKKRTLTLQPGQIKNLSVRYPD